MLAISVFNGPENDLMAKLRRMISAQGTRNMALHVRFEEGSHPERGSDDRYLISGKIVRGIELDAALARNPSASVRLIPASTRRAWHSSRPGAGHRSMAEEAHAESRGSKIKQTPLDRSLPGAMSKSKGKRASCVADAENAARGRGAGPIRQQHDGQDKRMREHSPRQRRATDEHIDQGKRASSDADVERDAWKRDAGSKRQQGDGTQKRNADMQDHSTRRHCATDARSGRGKRASCDADVERDARRSDADPKRQQRDGKEEDLLRRCRIIDDRSDQRRQLRKNETIVRI